MPIGNRNDPRRNSFGYSDPTAYAAINKISEEEDERFHQLLHIIFRICELAGYEIDGRIVLVDKRNGRIWR